MKNKTLLSLEFEKGQWSWGLISSELFRQMKDEIRILSMGFKKWKRNGYQGKGDFIMCQNVTQIKDIKDKAAAICRLGGNRSFDDCPEKDFYIRELGKCGAIIATNKHLYDIGKRANFNTFLIQNGLNINIWKPKENRKFHKRLVIGFCGNVSRPDYAEYKGYEIAKEGCRRAGATLKQALYRTGQIPHDRMMQDFYYKIDVLLHPTAGEGCSNTLMEACACGVPIITTRCAGYHGELMEHGRDVLFCERNAESITACIKEMSKDMLNQLSQGSRVFAMNHHDIRQVANEYRKVFTMLSKGDDVKVVEQVKARTERLIHANGRFKDIRGNI